MTYPIPERYEFVSKMEDFKPGKAVNTNDMAVEKSDAASESGATPIIEDFKGVYLRVTFERKEKKRKVDERKFT